MVDGIETNRKENVLVNFEILKEKVITIEKLDNDVLIAEFEKLLRNGAGSISVPLSWFRTEILKRLNTNEN